MKTEEDTKRSSSYRSSPAAECQSLSLIISRGVSAHPGGVNKRQAILKTYQTTCFIFVYYFCPEFVNCGTLPRKCLIRSDICGACIRWLTLTLILFCHGVKTVDGAQGVITAAPRTNDTIYIKTKGTMKVTMRNRQDTRHEIIICGMSGPEMSVIHSLPATKTYCGTT